MGWQRPAGVQGWDGTVSGLVGYPGGQLSEHRRGKDHDGAGLSISAVLPAYNVE